MGKAPAFQFFTKEYLASSRTRRMSAAERGIYVEMLVWQWEDGFVPDDPLAFARVASLDPGDVKAAWPVVRKCFTEKDGELRNKRLEMSRRDHQIYLKQKHDAGTKGAERRWGRRQAKSQPDKAMGAMAHPMRPQWPASALASASDLDLQEREKLLTPDRIGPDPEESQDQVAEDEGEELRPPTPTELSTLATLFQDYPERHAVRDHNTSAVYGSQAYAVTIRFLAPLFPDSRPGAGLSKEVTEWTGKIPIRDCAIAVREITRKLYPSVNGGRERTWNELDEGIQKRIVTHEFNAMLPVSG